MACSKGRDGALWARSSAYGDEQDWVLLRSDEKGGAPTYRAADVVYLIEKLERGFDRAIYVLGAASVGERMHPLALSAFVCTGAALCFAAYGSVSGSLTLGMGIAGWGWAERPWPSTGM